MSGANAVETEINDPLLYRAPLPYVARYYPYGFPVDVASNMREVLDAAHESFGAYAPRFDRPPMRVHVMASEGSGGNGDPPYSLRRSPAFGPAGTAAPGASTPIWPRRSLTVIPFCFI